MTSTEWSWFFVKLPFALVAMVCLMMFLAVICSMAWQQLKSDLGLQRTFEQELHETERAEYCADHKNKAALDSSVITWEDYKKPCPGTEQYWRLAQSRWQTHQMQELRTRDTK